MSHDISLFPNYSQSENRTTNYCLLALKQFYEEGPGLFSAVLSDLVGEQVGGSIGVSFFQQKKAGRSIPDGIIRQLPITIYVETKTRTGFDPDQLTAHLEALHQEDGQKILIALGNFDDDTSDVFTKIEASCRKKFSRTSFVPLSFETFIDVLDGKNLTKNLRTFVDDLRTYLDQEGLLPRWKNRLDVVNCAGLPEDILEGGVYMCPATGGSYNHQRCQYFGMYRNKKVERVAIIEAIVDVEDEETGRVLWRHSDTQDGELEKKACLIVSERRPGEHPVRVFLLGKKYETDFVKDSRGGMLSSKIYFDVASLDPKNAEDLAQKLRGKSWSNLGR